MYLTSEDLKTIYYPPAANMPDQEVTLYLQRANSYAFGIIGGVPAFHAIPIQERAVYENGLKAAVALAFECFTKGETAQVNKWNGDITEAAPAGYFQRGENRSHQWETVDTMLKPYADLYDSQNTVASDKGVMFL
jgi:hypothetical protein